MSKKTTVKTRSNHMKANSLMRGDRCHKGRILRQVIRITPLDLHLVMKKEEEDKMRVSIQMASNINFKINWSKF